MPLPWLPWLPLLLLLLLLLLMLSTVDKTSAGPNGVCLAVITPATLIILV